MIHFQIIAPDNWIDKNGNSSLYKIGGERAGTAGFIAPEVIQQLSYSELCDIFSCGVVLIMMVTGTIPFPKPKGIGEMVFNASKQTNKEFVPSKNYRLFMTNNAQFWQKLKADCNETTMDSSLKVLVSSMLEFNHEKRIDIENIQQHEWYNDKYYESKEITQEIQKLSCSKHLVKDDYVCKKQVYLYFMLSDYA